MTFPALPQPPTTGLPNGLLSWLRAVYSFCTNVYRRIQILGDNTGTSGYGAMFLNSGAGVTIQDASNGIVNFPAGINIATTANSQQQGLTVVQSGTGVHASSPFYFNQVRVTADDIDRGGHGFIDMFEMEHHYGGSNMTGGRNTFEVFAFLDTATNATNPNRNYTAGAFSAQANAPDNGVLPGSPLGAIFALGGHSILASGATGFLNMTFMEADVAAQAGSSVYYKSGIQICQLASDAVQGSNFDAALSFSNVPGAVGWNTGVLFSVANGAQPMASTGTLMATSGSSTVTNGIDISSYTYTGSSLHVPGFNIVGSSPTGIEFGRLLSAENPFIDWHSSGTNNDYDFRIQASGGSASVGTGSLVFTGGVLDLSNPHVYLNTVANGAVGTSVTGVGPTGANTTVQEWFKVYNSSGTARYVPAF